MSDDKTPEPIRTETGQFVAGHSGNPAGRPKGSKNRITLLRQSLELQLREQAEGHMSEVLATAINLAKQGDRTMLKLLLELHMSKGGTEDAAGGAKPQISINLSGAPEIKTVTPIDGETEDGQADE